MNKRFGVMLDMSRNAVMKPEEVKKYASVIKKLGYNMLQLYTEDTYEVINEPYFGYMRGRYSIRELKDIDSYCTSIGVEVIPCVQTLAHLGRIFKWNTYKNINDFADILLVDNERTYKLIENMIKTMRECFKSDYIHIGMDEAHMLGLGKYLSINGYQNRFSILKKHLERVLEIVKKYNFKPIMWSDMFYRLASNGEYYDRNAEITEEIKNSCPPEIGLVYWDYYHDDKLFYDDMIKSHKKFDRELWFGGGAWTWTGFTPNNRWSLQSMLPAMQSCRENDVENIFITVWGDDGRECSPYSILPSLHAVRCYYDGTQDMGLIKSSFKELTGEEFDAFMSLDSADLVGQIISGKQSNPSKFMLFSDLFNGFLDSCIEPEITNLYKKYAIELKADAEKSSYGYLFETQAALCEALALKSDLGLRCRKAYKEKDRSELIQIVSDIKLVIEKTEKLYSALRRQWSRENKPHGFDVQDQRFGGLLLRLKACGERISDYLDGKESSIPELDEPLLDYYGNGTEFERKLPLLNNWKENVSVNTI